ncbi:MAG: thioredoxin domain-containing protein [Anaerolineales bacterium]
MGKRTERRIKQRQQRIRNRVFTIVVIVGSALLLGFIFIYPSLMPIGEIEIPEPHDYPMVNGRAMGDPNAPVTIEIFEDFQCPACVGYTFTVELQIADTYVASGDVYYIYRHYPFLDDNAPSNESDQSAIASMCAADQGLFWEYHSILYANWQNQNQGAFNDRRLVAFAETIGLDMPEFESCFNKRTHYDEIMQDFERGNFLGVYGTPSVFINGEIIMPGYVPTFEAIQEAVDAILAGSDSP